MIKTDTLFTKYGKVNSIPSTLPSVNIGGSTHQENQHRNLNKATVPIPGTSTVFEYFKYGILAVHFKEILLKPIRIM